MTGDTRRRSSRNAKQNDEHSLLNTGHSSRSASANENNRRGHSSRSASANENNRRGYKRSATVTEKSSPRKRKRSLSPFQAPKVFKRSVDGRIVDAYCWICHKLSSESVCNSCPRVYHNDCLKKLKRSSTQIPSCECHLKTVDKKNDHLNLDARELKKLLQYVMQEAIKEEKKNKYQPRENSKFCRLFQSWPSENDDMCKIMDLNILLDNMNGENPYTSTGQFYLDIQWIYHNCYILYGPGYEITEAAFKLQKNFKQELSDMEACPECYSIKYSDDYIHASFFSSICSNPHPIVWAKLRGSPYWPAKCLKIHNGHVEVRFFGTHDKSNIPIDKCYKISKENPEKKKIQQFKYKRALQELSMYTANYSGKFGSFKFYPPKTVLEDHNTSVKKSSKKGRQRLNNAHPADTIDHNSGNRSNRQPADRIDHNSGDIHNCQPTDRIDHNSGDMNNVQLADRIEHNSDPMETKVSASFELLRNLVDGQNENIAESGKMLCQLLFEAHGHNGPANELNNSEEFMDTSASQCSLPESPGLLPTAGILPSSNEIVAAQNSLANQVSDLPVITSVSANESPLSPLPVICPLSSIETPDGLSTSSSLPVITSTTSASETAGFASDIFTPEETVKVPVTDLQTDGSSSVPSFTRQLYTNLMNDSNLNCMLEKDEDDEIQVVSERKKSSKTHDYLKNPGVLKAFSEVLLATKPEMKKVFTDFNTYILHYFLLLWIEICFSRFDLRDVENFLELCKKSIRKHDVLKRALTKSENARSEAEKARSEAEKARLEAERALAEAVKARAKAEEEIKELKKKVDSLGQGQLPNQKFELKNMIIQKACEKMQSKVDAAHRKTSENQLIQEVDSLSMQLAEARQKIQIKEEDIFKLRQENEKLKSLSVDTNTKDKVDTCDSAVQTEETQFESPEPLVQESDAAFVMEQSQDSSQLIGNNLEKPIETLNKTQEKSKITRTDVQVGMQSNMYIIERLSSVSTSSTLNTAVVQQVYEQNMLASECTAMVAAPSAGVINTAAPTLMSVPMVVPSHSVVQAPGPIFLDAESSATFLNSMNPPKPTLPTFGNVMKPVGGKRKKKNA